MTAEWLRIAAYVATPIAAICFLAAIAAWVYSRRLQSEEIRLNSLAQPDRARALDDWTIRVGLNVENLTREQKTEIVLTKLRHDADSAGRSSSNARLFAIVLAVLFVICFLAATAAYFFSDGRPVQAPPELPFESAPKANAPMFPPELFGTPQDHDARPRLWMQVMDCGAGSILGLEQEKTKRLWMLTEPFEEKYYPFTAHVYAGTSGKVVAVAFLVQPGKPPHITPLRRLSGLEPQGLFLFDVPKTGLHDRLLVFLAMSEASFHTMDKSRIRSKALEPNS